MLAAIFAVAALAVLSPPGSPAVLRAAIVDQVSVYDANPPFIAAATDILEEAGHLVDYYPGEQVTVDFYRELPTHGYQLIILRVHSSPVSVYDGSTSLYTSEPYDGTKYAEEQRTWRLSVARYYEGGPPYFAIMSNFVTLSMKGKFDDTTVIMMGCDGLKTDITAEAFVQKGAKSFVSWTGPVSWSHSDAAAERLLELLLLEGLTTEEAVSQTAAELGPDPSFGAELRILTGGG